MILKFKTNKQNLSRIDKNEAVELTQGYLTTEFETDEDWEGLTLTALFQKGNNVIEVILEDNSCPVPTEVIKSGGFAVSLLGVAGGKVLTSSKVIIYVNKTIDSSEAISPGPVTESLYAQLLERVKELEEKGVSPEVIAKAVEDYLSEHPIETLTEEEVNALISSFFNAHKSELKGDKGDKGDAGADYVISEADYNSIADVVLARLPQAEGRSY